ncbi:hypothetical protein PtB15_6B95 [Puccinia triticina]|nr:hypothetical protein PtB15_6B95 [Puccinia triticina]
MPASHAATPSGSGTDAPPSDRLTADDSPSLNTKRATCAPPALTTHWGEPYSGDMAPISQPRVLSSGPVGIPLASPTSLGREDLPELDQLVPPLNSLPGSPLPLKGPSLSVSDMFPADLGPEPDELKSSHSASALGLRSQ